MSTEVRLRRGTAAQHAAFTGALAEVTVNTDKKALHVHDGSTVGGNRTLMLSELGVASGVADLDSSGNIPASRLGSVTAMAATRTALKAIDTTKITSAYLRESGREGTFLWQSGDFSTQVATDTQEGIFVKATAIAATAGAWVRVFNSQVNVKWFGATADGVADDTVPIQKAINYAASLGGAEIHLPSGSYKTTATISLSGSNGLSLVGSGEANTFIKPNFLTGNVIEVNTPSGGMEAISIRGMTFDPSVTKTSGAIIYVQGTTNVVSIENIYIKKGFDGVWFDGVTNSVILKLDNFFINNCTNVGIKIGSTTRLQQDVYLTRGNVSACGTGILLLNVSGLFASNLDMVLCVGNGIQTFPDTGATAIFCFFSTVLADSSGNIGWAIQSNGGNVGDIHCVNCWSAASSGQAAVLIDSPFINGVSWVGGIIRANSQAGFWVERGKNITLSGAHIFNNSGAANNTYDGVIIASGVTDATITDNRIGAGGYDALAGAANKQRWGINMPASGTTANIIIEGNNLTGNVSGALLDGMTLTSKKISGNLGYITEARGVATVASGTGGIAVNHGLSGAPTTVICTLLDTGGGAQAPGANLPRVYGVGATQFSFDLGVLASANRPFSWEAKL